MERRYKSGRICFRPLLDSVQLTTCQQHLWLDRSYYSCVQVRVSCAIENEDDDVVFRVFRILLIEGTIVIYKDKYSGRYSYGGRKGGGRWIENGSKNVVQSSVLIKQTYRDKMVCRVKYRERKTDYFI